MLMATPRSCASSFQPWIPLDVQPNSVKTPRKRRKDRVCRNIIKKSQEPTDDLMRACPFLQNKGHPGHYGEVTGCIPSTSIQAAMQEASEKIDWILQAVATWGTTSCDRTCTCLCPQQCLQKFWHTSSTPFRKYSSRGNDM